jgi:hypothetical protein
MFVSYFDGNPMYDNHLEHHGILGMHWGIRRFQPYPKDYHGSGKEIGKAAKVKPRMSKAAAKRAKLRSKAANDKAKAQAYAAAKEAKRIKTEAKSSAEAAKRSALEAREASKANVAESKRRAEESKAAASTANLKRGIRLFGKTERGKRKAIRSGNLKKVKRYASMMSNEEYKAALDRCNYVADAKMKDLETLSRAGKTIADGMMNIANFAKYGISLHDSIATVHNARSSSGKEWKKWDGESPNEKAWKAQSRKMDKWKWAIETGINPDTFKPIDPSDPMYAMYMNRLSKGKTDKSAIEKILKDYGLI